MLARMRKQSDQGFTLVELLVVMIIIGILAAIAVPIFLNQRKKSYDVSVKSDMKTMANEMRTYYSDNQSYAVSYFGTGAPNASGVATSFAWTDSGGKIGADTIRLSANVTLTLFKYGTNGFCVYGTAGSAGSGTYYIYDSTQGGLLSTTETTVTAAKADCNQSY